MKKATITLTIVLAILCFLALALGLILIGIKTQPKNEPAAAPVHSSNEKKQKEERQIDDIPKHMGSATTSPLAAMPDPQGLGGVRFPDNYYDVDVSTFTYDETNSFKYKVTDSVENGHTFKYFEIVPAFKFQDLEGGHYYSSGVIRLTNRERKDIKSWQFLGSGETFGPLSKNPDYSSLYAPIIRAAKRPIAADVKTSLEYPKTFDRVGLGSSIWQEDDAIYAVMFLADYIKIKIEV